MICTIVEDPIRKKYRLEELRNWLLKCNYDKNLINSKFRTLMDMDISTLRQKVSREKEQPLVFVQCHNPTNPNIFGNIRTFLNNLKTNDKMAHLLSGVQIIKSERQPKNIGNLLTHSYIGTSRFINGVKKCGKNCSTCPYIEEGESTSHMLTHILKLSTNLIVTVDIYYTRYDVRDAM